MVRLVPTETVTLYAAATALIPAGAATTTLCAIAGVVATVVTLAHDARRARRQALLAQHVVRVLAFSAWAFLLANPLAPAAPVARWLPALAVVLVPVIGCFMFPAVVSRSDLDAQRRR